MSTNGALPIVLVAGLSQTPRLYREQLTALWGFGPVTLADHTRGADIPAIARNILDRAPLRFALIGLSLGGYLAFEMLRQASQRISHLALLDTNAGLDTEEQRKLRQQSITLVEAGRYEEVVETAYARQVHPSRRDDDALIAAVSGMARVIGPDVYIRQQRAIMGRPDSRPDLARISCRTLVMVGDRDQISPPERAHEIANGIRGATLVTVPECGHLSPLERPEAVTHALAAWLRS